MKTGYFAPEGLEEELKRELPDAVQYGRLFIAEGMPKSRWAQNIWHDVQEIRFRSISDAAKELRALQKLWAYHPFQFVRRGELIASQLPYFSPKPVQFPSVPPAAPLGAWTLIEKGLLIAAAKTSSPFARGEVHFEESKVPPSRAYLKLWEFLTRAGKWPKRGEKCLEVGASPGSWTWALQQLGAEVLAVDRAPLDPAVARLPGVTFQKGDAFSIVPGAYDWVFSDVICYPEKLLEWIEPWLKTNTNLVCTIKFQGPADPKILDAFEAIGTLTRLYNNKHELTWSRLL